MYVQCRLHWKKKRDMYQVNKITVEDDDNSHNHTSIEDVIILINTNDQLSMKKIKTLKNSIQFLQT